MKKTFNNCLKSCISYVRKNILIFVFLLLYVLFYEFWENLIGEYIVTKFLCHFEKNIISDILFYFFIIGCYFYFLYNGYKYQRKKDYIFCVIAILFWIHYRIISKRFDFFSLYTIDFIKYVDIIPLYIFIKYLIVHIWKNNKKKKKKENVAICDMFDSYIYLYGLVLDYSGFVKDIPIKKYVYDFDSRRRVFAEKIVDRLLNTDIVNEAYTFGINAPWGDGKTSLMNLMKLIITHKTDSIIVDFNPWLYSSDKNLITAFIDELCGELKKYDKFLANNLIDFSKILTAFDTKETKLVASIISLFHHKSTLEDKKKEIKSSIKSINKKIFVFIDDLDRLDADELMEMMKLIRNISDFPIYIVAAYDKIYLVQCLEEKVKTEGGGFVDKIIQHEFHLPPITSKMLREYLCNYITEVIGGGDLGIIEDDNQDNPFTILSNIREIKKFVNHFTQSYYQIGTGFSKKDLLLFELFKFKYPSVYSFFEQNIDKILEKNVEQNYYYLCKNGNEVDKINFYKVIEEKQQEFNIDKNDLQIIHSILDYLFNIDSHKDDTEFYFNDVSWLNRYIYQFETGTDIPDEEFDKVMSSHISLTKNIYLGWMMAKSQSWRWHLLGYSAKNKESLLNLIYSILCYSKTIIKDEYLDESHVFFRLKRLNEINYDYTVEDKQTIFLAFDMLNNRTELLRISEIIALLYNDKMLSNILTDDDIVTIQKKVFKECLRLYDNVFNKVINHYFAFLNAKGCFSYHIIATGCFPSRSIMIEKEKKNIYNIIPINKPSFKRSINIYDKYVTCLNNLMQDYIKNNILEVIPYIIVSYVSGKYSIANYLELIWDGWDNFYNSIVTLDNENPVLNEFKEFLEKFKENRYKNIKYKFKLIKPKG